MTRLLLKFSQATTTPMLARRQVPTLATGTARQAISAFGHSLKIGGNALQAHTPRVSQTRRNHTPASLAMTRSLVPYAVTPGSM